MNIIEALHRAAIRARVERDKLESIVKSLPGYKDYDCSHDDGLKLLQLIEIRMSEMQAAIDHNDILAQEGE